MQVNIPRVAFGNGFVNTIGRRVSANAHVYPVDVSNGMPIVTHKHPILEKMKKSKKSMPKTRASALGQK